MTIDFHNTLARCDEWFEIEVRSLVPGFLSWWVAQSGERVAPHLLCDEAVALYRRLRREVMATGIERDAASCLRQVTRELRLDIPDDDVVAGLEAIMLPALEHVEPQPGAVETVKHLHAEGVPLAIVSSAIYHPFLEWTVAKFGLEEEIGLIISSAACGHYKSHPAIYEVAAEALGREPRECVHVGDSLEFDVRTASIAGMRTVWFNQGGESPNGAVPDLTVTTLEGLGPSILTRFGRGA